jgi:hypothetical protein
LDVHGRLKQTKFSKKKGRKQKFCKKNENFLPKLPSKFQSNWCVDNSAKTKPGKLTQKGPFFLAELATEFGLVV